MREVLYLHGFASSPGSRKARFLAERFAEIGARLTAPDLAEEGFGSLTISGQLRVIERAVSEWPPTLIVGSSLGGYLAALYAARHPGPTPALALLAPAFGFPARWAERLGEERMLEWRRNGRMEVFHYGEGRPAAIDFGFYQDALRFDPTPRVEQPTLILHGKTDEVVPPEYSAEFARNRPNVAVEWLETDHGMLDALDRIWERISEFFQERAAA